MVDCNLLDLLCTGEYTFTNKKISIMYKEAKISDVVSHFFHALIFPPLFLLLLFEHIPIYSRQSQVGAGAPLQPFLFSTIAQWAQLMIINQMKCDEACATDSKLVPSTSMISLAMCMSASRWTTYCFSTRMHIPLNPFQPRSIIVQQYEFWNYAAPQRVICRPDSWQPTFGKALLKHHVIANVSQQVWVNKKKERKKKRKVEV